MIIAGEKPLVSIAMASYNGEKYISQQIDSILSQTYPNIELVIVDDGSTDNTVEIVQEYEAKFPFVHIYRNPVNSGITKTFESAIKKCKGEFIALSDQDDIWVAHKIQTLMDAINGYDAVYSDSMLVDESGNSLDKKFSSMIQMDTVNNGARFLLSNTVPGHTILMKRSFAETLYPFPSHVFFDLWISFNAAAGNGIKFVDDTLVHYRQHTSNAVGTRLSSNKKERFSAEKEFAEKKQILEALYNGPVKEGESKAILKEMLEHFHHGWSFKRSAFFFRHFNDILAAKKKPFYRKVLYCMKMFFKPNY
jgi:glycosyltransferase involved in cell wall biosynthesis